MTFINKPDSNRKSKRIKGRCQIRKIHVLQGGAVAIATAPFPLRRTGSVSENRKECEEIINSEKRG